MKTKQKLLLLIPQKDNIHKYMLLIILLLGFILRFYNFPLRYGFDFDASRDAVIASYGARHLEFPLVGAGSSVAPFYFGPWYYYQLILFNLISPEYGSWVYIGLASLLCIVIAYKIGEVLEGKIFGLLLSGIVSVALSQVTISTTLSNPSLIPLFAFLSVLLFLKIYEEKFSFALSFLLGLVLGVGITTHYQMIGLITLPVVLTIFKSQNRLKFSFSVCFGFFISFLPLIFYDIMNNWYNLNGALYYLTNLGGGSHASYRWLFYIRDFWPNFWGMTIGIPNAFALLLVCLLIFECIYLFTKKKIKTVYLLLVICFFVNFIQFRYFPTEKAIYYLYSLQIFVLIFTGIALFQLLKLKKGIIPFTILILLMLFFVLPKDLKQLHAEQTNIEYNNNVKVIYGYLKGSKVAFYNCDTNNLDKAFASIFLLDNKHMLSSSGRKIGFKDDSCDSSGGILLESISAVDLSGVNVKELEERGWVELTPQKIFNSNNFQFRRNY